MRAEGGSCAVPAPSALFVCLSLREIHFYIRGKAVLEQTVKQNGLKERLHTHTRARLTLLHSAPYTLPYICPTMLIGVLKRRRDQKPKHKH